MKSLVCSALSLLLCCVTVNGLRLPTPINSGSTDGTSVTRADALRMAFASLAIGALPASADDTPATVIGQIPASGIIFKDIVKVERFDDPKVQGVELYVSDFQRPITERLSKDFFSDPTQAAVTCVTTGKVTVSDDIDVTETGEEVFSQARSLLFKSVNVRRLYDKEKGIVLYVSYSTRLNKGDDEQKSRFKTTMCAVRADVKPRPPAPPVEAPDEASIQSAGKEGSGKK